MVEVLRLVLPYALPPVLGAVIGYVTNAIAIRMLFRPLTEKRFLGVRVPFTPGIIPRQRRQLAESMAKMVSTQLLNADSVRQHVNSASFQGGIREQVAQFTGHLLDASPILDRSESDVRTIGAGVSEFLTGLFSRFVQSDSFERVSNEFVRRGFEFLSGLSVSELFPSIYRRSESEVVEILEPIVARVLGERVQSAIKQAALDWVREIVTENRRLDRFISEETVNRLTLFAAKLYMPAVRSGLHWLNEEEVKADLSTKAKVLLRKILERLNFFQRFLVSAAQYDRTLEERMPRIIDDLIESLREAAQNPETKARVLRAVSRRLDDLRREGIADACNSVGIDIETIAGRLLESAMAAISGEEAVARISRTIYRALEGQRDLPVIELLRDSFGVTQQSVQEWLAERVRELRLKPKAASDAASLVSTLLGGLLEEARTRPLSDILGLSADQKASVDDFISKRILSIIDERLPDIVQAFDIRGLVENKINSLDVGDVEKLLLMVIAKQLKWINLFGGILGALIGGTQVLIGILT
ncbi:MAG TPA: DUF445 family protein [Spirochaetia bacterium]|nr:DUF445 family protein [Spirochaetia bacterium]